MRQIKLLTLFVATMFATNMWAAIAFGDNLQWQLNTIQLGQPEKELVITLVELTVDKQDGTMPDFSVDYAPFDRPGWYTEAANIVSISLPYGLKNISKHAFAGMTNAALTELEIPETVDTIGDKAIRISHLETLYCRSANAPRLGNSVITEHAAENFSIVYECGINNFSYITGKWLEYYNYITPACGGSKPSFEPSNSFSDNTNAMYRFNGSTGELRIYVNDIYESGATDDYTNMSYQPWADYRNLITSIVVEEGITSLGNNIFNSLPELTEVSLPSTLTSIGERAFSSCTSLASISIPANVTAIGIYAFAGSGLTSISIPANVSTIGNYAFQNCASLATVTFASPNSALTSIGSNAFKGTALTSVTIPATTNGLTIGQQAFAVASITSLSFASPSNVIELGDRSFNGTGITSVTLPATAGDLTTNRAFEGCSSLATVSFASPSKVTTLGARTFESTAIASITIPASVTNIGGSAFKDCSNLQEVIFEGNTCPTIVATTNSNNAFRGTHADIVFKCPNDDAVALGYANTMYPYYQNGWYWEKLYKMNGEHAPAPHQEGTCGYNGGDNLTWQTNSGTLTISGTGAMAEWDFLNNSVAPWNKYKPGITRIEIAEGVTTIGGSAFYNCDKVKTFIIPSTVTSIGADAFFSCDNPEVEVYCYADPNNLTWTDRNCDDFLSYSPGTGTIRSASYTPGTLHLQETKCYVSSGHLAKYVEKWYQGSTDWFCGTDVNVFFAVGLNDANDAAGINAILNDTHGENVPIMTITRPVKRDGYFNTFCFPFNMSAEQIAASAISSAVIKEFTGASVGSGVLNLEFTETDHIEAGKPYFIKFDNAADLDRIDFLNVTIDKTAPQEVTYNGVTMIGTYVPKAVSAQSGATDGDGVLFLGPNNTLYWPSAAGNIKPFRAYFKIAGGSGSAPIRRGMPARIVERENTATGVGEVESQKSNGESLKVIENGRLIIIRNGEKFNAQGMIVK